ncbi:hypothetical protein KI387_022482, partial [Taxus chinensis]
MGGGSPSPSENADLMALDTLPHNYGIQPSFPPTPPGATVACPMPISFRGPSPPRPPHFKHKGKCHLKIQHRHHEHRHGGKKDKRKSPHCHHKNKHMDMEPHLGCKFHHR